MISMTIEGMREEITACLTSRAEDMDREIKEAMNEVLKDFDVKEKIKEIVGQEFNEIFKRCMEQAIRRAVSDQNIQNAISESMIEGLIKRLAKTPGEV